jgi:predicted ribosome quality control (RQC) complex YloA/Tae2 family protein
MAFDGFLCIAVAGELNEWAGARVDKLFFGSSSTLCLSLYRAGSRSNLVITAAASSPIVALTKEEPLRPELPDGLTMLFRKHLVGSRLLSVSCVKNERIIRFEFDSADDMGYIKKRYIYAEMMGKYSNIVLCDEKNRILGASSVADITASVRQIMAGMPYELPPAQSKNELKKALASKEQFFKLIDENREKRADSFLVSSFFSFSPLVAREIIYRTCGRTDETVYALDCNRFYDELNRLCDIMEHGRFCPVLICGTNGEGIEYSFFPITQYGNDAVIEEKESFSALLTEFYRKKAEDAALKQHASDILRIVNNAKTRLQKKIALQKRELEECRKREKFKKEGDLITANLYRLKQGEDKALLYDFESEKEVIVSMDSRLSPANNAQKRYKKYSKLKKAEGILLLQIKNADKDIRYIESVYDFIVRVGSVPELAEIRSELTETGYIAKKKSRKKQKNAPHKPLSYTTSGGFSVRVGRNNKENDSLAGSADKDDIWFHIKGFHGSHVLLYTNGIEPSERDYTEAAQIAAYHSEKRGSENVAVDYTRVRYLKKPNGSPPGFVTYGRNWTAFVNAVLPD